MIWTCTDKEDGEEKACNFKADSFRRETKRAMRADWALVSDCRVRVCDYSLMINAWHTRANASVMAFDKPTQHQGA